MNINANTKTKEEYFSDIKELITNTKIVLFAKGLKDRPACGFSAHVMEILNEHNADYTVVNILSDQNLRQYLKEFSDWQTYPQLYVDGEFIGGADIVSAMYENGELKNILTKTL